MWTIRPGHGAAVEPDLNRSLPWVIIVCSAALQVCLLRVFYPFTADDSYIVARYARNLAEHGALVFNPGERISALTSPLFALIEAGVCALTGQTLAAIKPVAVLLVVAGCLMILRDLRGDPRRMALCSALLLPSPFLALWTVGGLETPLLFLLVTAATLEARRARTVLHGGGAVRLSLLLGLIVLTRHDAVLFAAPLALALIVRHPRQAARMALPGLAVTAAWLVLARIYFGSLLPTSFYVKMVEAYPQKGNVAYVAQAFVVTGLAGVVAWGILRRTVDLRRWAGWRLRISAIDVGLVAGLSCVLLFAMCGARLHMMFANRMLLPYLGAFSLLAVEFLGERVIAPLPLTAAAVALCVLHAGLGWMLWARSLNPGITGEYRDLSVRSYVRDFTRVLEAGALAIQNDWKTRPQGTLRPPRVWTFAGGILPYQAADVYVYELLVSYRTRCHADYRPSADYLHVLAPRHGTLEQQLPGSPERFELISSNRIVFDGASEEFLVFFNPEPTPHTLPPTLDGKCVAPAVTPPASSAP